jgi:hypothetical protein
MKYTVGMASCGMIYLPSVIKPGTGAQAILRVCLKKLRGYSVGIIDGRDFFNCAVEMGSGATIHVPSPIKVS